MSREDRRPKPYNWIDADEAEGVDETAEERMRILGMHIEEGREEQGATSDDSATPPFHSSPGRATQGLASQDSSHGADRDTGVTAGIVLGIWEEYHGNLDEKWRETFLASPFVKELTQYPIGVIRQGIRTHKKLDLALEEVENLNYRARKRRS